MAQLLLVDTEVVNPPYNNMDDVVGVFDDKHKFSERELFAFNIVNVTGSREDVQRRINKMRPVTTRAFFSTSADEYTLTEPSDIVSIEGSWILEISYYYTTGYSTRPNRVMENVITKLKRVASKMSLGLGCWWWDVANNRVYVRTTDDTDPSTHTIEIYSSDIDHEIKVWSTMEPPGRWYKLVNEDKFIFSIADLRQSEKDYIADPGFDVNSGLVDSYLKKFAKNLGRKPENTVEITEIRGDTP